MATYVLDASAVLRFVDRQAGIERMEAILLRESTLISAAQWSEIAAIARKRLGPERQRQMLSHLLGTETVVAPIDRARAERAAHWRIQTGLSFADSFALELALESPDRVLVTADYDFKAAEHLVAMEFLPAK